MGCTPSKPVRGPENTEAMPNCPRDYTSPKQFRGSMMMGRVPDSQATHLHQNHGEDADCLGKATADSSTTFDQLADRGVISRDALKRGNYMPK